MQWSIKIVAKKGQKGGATQTVFVPPPPDNKAAGSLKVLTGDTVSWNNTTDQVHQPWPTDQNYQDLPDTQVGKHGDPDYLADEIAAHDSSRPAWIVRDALTPGNPKTVFYRCRCKNHENERGTIVIMD